MFVTITIFLNNFSRNIVCVSKSVKDFWIQKGIKKNKLEIKPSMMQLAKEIKSLGNFKVKIDLHSQIQAEIDIKVVAEEAA